MARLSLQIGWLLLCLINIGMSDVICPPLEMYVPCGCVADSAGDGNTIALECHDHLLGDARVSEILDVFLTTPSISPVSSLSLFRNLLTRVPDQIVKFTQLDSIILDHNSIHTIAKNSFNFIRSPRYVWLSNNQMTSIEKDSFQGNIITILN